MRTGSIGLPSGIPRYLRVVFMKTYFINLWTPFNDRVFGANWFRILRLEKSYHSREEQDMWKAILVAQD